MRVRPWKPPLRPSAFVAVGKRAAAAKPQFCLGHTLSSSAATRLDHERILIHIQLYGATPVRSQRSHPMLRELGQCRRSRMAIGVVGPDRDHR